MESAEVGEGAIILLVELNDDSDEVMKVAIFSGTSSYMLWSLIESFVQVYRNALEVGVLVRCVRAWTKPQLKRQIHLVF